MTSQPPTAAPAAAEAATEMTRTRPRHARYDLVIIGGGSAGLPAAELAAVLGARVALVDRETLGGECLYTGCVPSKALLHVARVAWQARTADRLGLAATLAPVDLGAVADQVARVVGRVGTRDTPERFEARGIEVLFGAARFTGPRTLVVNGHAITARAFLVCTGSHAATPELAGLAGVPYHTNDTIFGLRALPATLTIVGGGPVGVELGQAFARLGARVTIVQRAPRLLPREEPEASSVIERRLAAEGVTLLLGATAQGVAQREGAVIVSARGADGAALEVAGEQLLIATGRAANVAGLGLEAAGIAFTPQRGIQVDARRRTSNRHIYAAGDVTGPPYFTHAAAQQALAAVRAAVTPFGRDLDTRALAWAIFTEPEVARVGLTEAEARARHGASVRTYALPFSAVDRADTDEVGDGFVKLVATGRGALVGAQLVGAHAGEYINELALALRQQLDLGQLAATTHVYPTMALAIQQAAARYSYGKLVRGALPGVLRAYRRLAR
ncbi:MAG TPA: FAD-dependent oxidoreductase [Ktedonobacterales bacterium]|nr:FAD-dependent oxidoreductase [Ktedonobacterales bacterium]